MLIHLLHPTVAWAERDWYVAVNGDDKNDGSINSPLLTIREAQSRVKEGETVYIRGGVYRMQISSNPARRGLFYRAIVLDKAEHKIVLLPTELTRTKNQSSISLT